MSRVHVVTHRYLTDISWLPAANSTIDGSINRVMTMRLTDIPAYTEYTAMYDQYVVKSVRVVMQCVGQYLAVTPTDRRTNDEFRPFTILIAFDKDDAGAEDYSALLHRKILQKTMTGYGQSFSFRMPVGYKKVVAPITSSTAVDAGVAVRPGLMDVANTTFDFGSVKFGALTYGPLEVGQVYQMRMQIYATIAWKGRR